MWIKRSCEPTLSTLFSQFPSVVVTGPRQVGKTSLVRRIFPDLEYVSLDLPSLAEQAEKSPNSFLNSRKEPLIIDEIQYAPSLPRHLKVKIDENKRPGRFILTGSQNFSLMQGVSESLAGRCGILNMLNLSAAEVKQAFDRYDENAYLLKGGFPELYERPDIDPRLWYASYLSTYLERDVRNILNVGSLRDFDRFLRAAAARTSQILSYSELARDVGISPNTARQWISVLQASGQIFLLEPYHRNLGKRLIKSPKIYFCDTGLALFLMGFDTWEAVSRHPVVGAIWETHVVMQVVKHYQSSARRVPLWFWRTIHGAEVDLLVERGGRFVAVEAKFSESPDKANLKGILAFKKFYGGDFFEKGLLACRTPHPYPLSEEVSAVPGSLIDLHLS
ncbi:MAG: ATP-binding protein [Candidatus Aminicenantes bacterium]|nr:ATP-binding protein [Candidatus Aminicenantes bacterium]